MTRPSALLFLLIATTLPAKLVGTVLDVGQLELIYDNGYQEISFFNNTGPTAGCGSGGSDYLACSGINISTWTLTLVFDNENPTNPSPSYSSNISSPLSFTSSPADSIGPYDGTNAFTGGSSGTWEIPLSFGDSDEPPCGPTCDYQLTQVTFSGTLDPSTLPVRLNNGQTYDGNNPSTYSIFNAQPTFSASWTIAASDYSLVIDPEFLTDSTDVFVSDQPGNLSTTPEPSTAALILAGIAAAAVTRRKVRNAQLN